ncbi:MAG: hypothetical protein QOI35_61 [Cryptosporangiaceae bacterium]|jgi:uncharacterized repeat protein (TIGR03843 family)|nr:hypothetical protein [Cryptosporangiaceae bacterium]MDQ1655527.1 hypothetical protein [Cryptosporangiaceae bacterium]
MSEPDAAGALDLAESLVLLTLGDLAIEGRLVDASNATMFCTVTLDGTSAGCVYKPVRGERPLWDFPDGTLAGREVSAYLVSEAAGWGLIPPTVLRDGPLGPGMCQLWIETGSIDGLVDIVRPGRVPGGWHPILDGMDGNGREVVVAHADDDRLRRLAVLDLVVNNADRKGGHLLLDSAGALYGVDHGICFHSEDKVRTLLWGWAGQRLSAGEREVLTALAAGMSGDLGEALHEHLTRREVTATRRRIEALLRSGCFPEPGPGRPRVPWPPF